MRITFLMPADDLTGGNRVVACYAKHLIQRGHQVLVVSSGRPRPTLREYARAVYHGQLPALRQGLASKPGHIALSGVPHRQLAKCRPIDAADLPDADVVVATWWETAEWMAQLPACKGHKVHLIQGYEIWWGGEAHRARVHAALRLPNSKIAISTSLKRDIECALGEQNITVLPNAIDLQRFNAPPRQRGTPPRVGFIYAANSPFKGVDRALKAIEIARQALPQLQVCAFGTQQPTADLPLPPGTCYWMSPPQDQLASIYSSCDAWLFTSRVDSFGLPILEAMACRTPVIGVPVGAAPELLADGRGILVSDDSAADVPARLAEAILNLCRAPERDWLAMSERAYHRARVYSWEDATDRLESLLGQSVSHGHYVHATELI